MSLLVVEAWMRTWVTIMVESMEDWIKSKGLGECNVVEGMWILKSIMIW